MRMLSPAEVADITGLSRSAIYRAVEDGELAASKLRGRIRIEESEVEAWKNRSRVSPQRPVPAYEPPVRAWVGAQRDTFRGELQALKKGRVA